jgi:hypothetical protein
MDYSIVNKTPDVAQAVVGHYVDANGNAVPQSAATPLPVTAATAANPTGQLWRTPASQRWGGTNGAGGIIAANGLVVSATEQARISNMLDLWWDCGAYQCLDAYWDFGCETATGALCDIVNGLVATPHGSPTFAAGSGYTFSGSNYIDSNFNAATKTTKFSEYDAMFGTVVLTDPGVGLAVMGNDETNAGHLFPHKSSTNADFAVNASGDSAVAHNGKYLGVWQTQRLTPQAIGSGSPPMECYQNGACLGSLNTAATAIKSQTFFIGGSNNAGLYQGCTGELGGAFIGKAMEVRTIIQAFHESIRRTFVARGTWPA